MTEEAAILRAIAALESKMTAASNKLREDLTFAIGKLADAHHRTEIEQERRNSTFADRDRVETVAEHVHINAGQIMSVTGRTAQLEKDLAALVLVVESDDHRATDRTLGLSTFTISLLVSVLVAITAVVGSYVLYHLALGHP